MSDENREHKRGGVFSFLADLLFIFAIIMGCDR